MNAHTRLNDTTKSNLLSQKAVLASVTIGGWSARKLDRKITDETNERHNASKDAGRYNKLLLPKESLDPITSVMSKARAEHYRVTLPWMDDGARILPTAMYMDYMTKVRALKEEYEREVRKFARTYPKLVEDAPKRLGSAFNPQDFPASDRVEAMFYFDIKVLPCPDASDFRVDIADEHLIDIKADLEVRMKSTLDAAMKDPINRVIDVVSKMAERLKNYKPAGRTKGGKVIRAEFTFRDSLVENVRDLVSLLPALNLTGDRALTKICSEMNKSLTRYDAEELRVDDAARKATAEAAEAILKQAEALMA